MKKLKNRELKFSRKILGYLLKLKTYTTQKVIDCYNVYLKTFDSQNELDIYLTLNQNEKVEIGRKSYYK